jgi:hypothetical protein
MARGGGGALRNQHSPILVMEGLRGSGKTALLSLLDELLDQRVPRARVDFEVARPWYAQLTWNRCAAWAGWSPHCGSPPTRSATVTAAACTSRSPPAALTWPDSAQGGLRPCCCRRRAAIRGRPSGGTDGGCAERVRVTGSMGEIFVLPETRAGRRRRWRRRISVVTALAVLVAGAVWVVAEAIRACGSACTGSTGNASASLTVLSFSMTSSPMSRRKSRTRTPGYRRSPPTSQWRCSTR